MNLKTKIAIIIVLAILFTGMSSIYYIVLLETRIIINRAPVISNLPDQTLHKDSQSLNAFDLDNYTIDPDSEVLFYSIIGNTNPQCGVSIDNESRIDIIPERGWAGISNITIQASDGKLITIDSFMINVTELEPEVPHILPYPVPFDEDFWQELLSYIAPENIPTLLGTLYEMFDSDIDDLDLGNYSMTLLDLLYTEAGEIELFRVYNYSSLTNMSDVLWKYECFDQYTGAGWYSTGGKNLYDFYTYGNYYSKYFPNPELLKIKMPISPQLGINFMVIPSLFPIPFIMEGSIFAPNLELASTHIYKTEYNSTIVDFSFSSYQDVNLTYELFGLEVPLDEVISNTALSAIYTPLYIVNKYLQLPPSINIYKTINPFFKNHWDILNGIINEEDNAFVVADKIRNYLQSVFSFPLTSNDYNPAPEGVDIVEWFCENQQGVYSDFASAFCAFTRAFGVSSRFVNGFNSINITEDFDIIEGTDFFPIKYKNIYCWAEIYVPTEINGGGKWVQIDLFDN